MKIKKTSKTLAILIAASTASALAVDAYLPLAQLNCNPATNRIVEIQRQQPFPGNLTSNWSGAGGFVVVSNVAVGDYNVWVRKRGQAGEVSFSFSIATNDSGTVFVHTNNLSVLNAGTYPKTGQAAWSIEASESRYAPKGSAGTAVSAAELAVPSTNAGVVTITVPTNAVKQLTVAGSTNSVNATNLYPAAPLSVDFLGGTLTSGNSTLGPSGLAVNGGGALKPSGFEGNAAGLTNIAATNIIGTLANDTTGTAGSANQVNPNVTNQWRADALTAAGNATNKLKSDIAAGSVTLPSSALDGAVPLALLANAELLVDATNAALLARLAETNAVLQTLLTAATTNTYDYISPADPSVTPRPDIYYLTDYGGVAKPTEAEFISNVNIIATNGLTAYGWSGIQFDAGWASRTAAGALVMNTNLFTNNLAYLCNYAHTNGLRVGVYYCILTNAGLNLFGQPNMHTNMQADLDTLRTNGVDWIKIDSHPRDGIDPAQNPVKFWNAVAQMGWKVHRQQSVGGGYGNSGNYYALSPTLAKGLNSAYVALGLPDTYTPRSFTNYYQHFLRSVAARHHVGQGFLLEGTAWVYGYMYDQLPAEHAAIDMALMTGERVMAKPNGTSYTQTNRWLWDLVRSTPVTVFDKSVSNVVDSAYSRIIGNVADGVRAVCFINTAETNKTTTYNLLDLGFPKNEPVTYFSPYFHDSLEGWATNTITVTVPPTNTVLYKIVRGYKSQIPAAGKTYLSDLMWDSTCNVLRGPFYSYAGTLSKDFRDGLPSSPLIIGATTYTKGFCVGGGVGWTTNPVWTVNIGYAPSDNPQLVTAFGKQQAWNGGSSGIRLTIWTNGVLSTRSDFVTNNTTQATNFVVPLAGVRSITFMGETNGVACQGVLGGCYITNSIP